ncbi:MAG: transcription-repair coupling factor [Oscillospiraceae bacterium]|nr:transcription-repair coupling factor [Oscillospiraceae bacterium]
MKYFNKTAELIPQFRELVRAIENDSPGMVISGLSRVHKAHFVASLAECFAGVSEVNPPRSGIASKGTLLILVDNENEAVRLCEDINTLCNNEVALNYPSKDLNLINAETTSTDYEHKRISVLSRLPSVIVGTPEAAVQLTFSPKELSECIIHIKKDSEVNTESLLSDLVNNGYSRVDLVESVSQFSVRGSVIDVYSVSGTPVRIDLWGDTVDSISVFDTESQRSVEKVVEVAIPPCREPRLAKSSNSRKSTENGAARTPHPTAKSATKSTLFDYVHKVIVCEQNACAVHLKSVYEQYKADLEIAAESGAYLRNKSGKHLLSKSEYESVLEKKKVVVFDTFASGANKQNSQVSARNIPPWNGDFSQLKSDLKKAVGDNYTVCVFAGTEKSARGLALDLRDDGFKCDYSSSPEAVSAGHIYVTAGTLSGGFEYPETTPKCMCITHYRGGGESRGVGREVKTFEKRAKKKNKSQIIRALSDINVGDYIVHDNYGIGVFDGVKKLTSDGVSKDYIKLRYAGKDVLYVPVTQLDFIARYIGNTETASLKLSKLHTDTWFNTKTRVKKAVEELAQELIELYSKRMRSKGTAFGEDTREQGLFESKFSYVETDDQVACIRELKRDMRREQPMDRLLCGDVGFGKTEVALRGAFKCVMEGYQCALLCPTTVLAWQHYQTAVSRMEGFPVNIELLSRFRSVKEKNEVVRKLKSGVVDLVIGTHALVAKSVEFKNLGLVIIDEEQRFGVAQKERLKEAFPGVDVLSLSATPIPRTLNMAMSGIRDMSVIESPPHDRQPVTTYVIEHDYGVIAGAINKELRRAGQVYYLHNRVETIVSCAAKIHELVPEARIGIAHGRMDERELLDVWRRLLEREIDVLVCTTLIETGVDVQNVNTLIIENADKMGLAQLHQLRGRVGRTNRRAFAYFTFSRGKVLSEIAEKRLKAVKEFTQFGAGFKIALRDLEIRGAGSVLGESQSGHLSSVGYETYVRLLEQAVEELSGRESGGKSGKDGWDSQPGEAGNASTGTVSVVDIKIDAFVPETYISNQAQRISCYKRIAEIRDEDDAVDVADELTDRYGAIPKSVNGLIQAARIRNMASRLGIGEVVQNKDRLILYWESPDMERISRVDAEFAGRVELNFAGRVAVYVKLMKNDDVVDVITRFLGIL